MEAIIEAQFLFQTEFLRNEISYGFVPNVFVYALLS